MDIDTFANFMKMVAEAIKFLTQGVNFIAPVFEFFAKIPNLLGGLIGGGGGGFDLGGLGDLFGGLF